MCAENGRLHCRLPGEGLPTWRARGSKARWGDIEGEGEENLQPRRGRRAGPRHFFMTRRRISRRREAGGGESKCQDGRRTGFLWRMSNCSAVIAYPPRPPERCKENENCSSRGGCLQADAEAAFCRSRNQKSNPKSTA